MGRDDDTVMEQYAPSDRRDSPASSIVLGRYALGESLGRGGFGEVLEAQDLVLDKPVAIKRLPALDDTQLAYARAEVTALRRARLPGVVELLDDGLWQGRFVLVMQRIAGPQFPGESTPMPWSRLRPQVIRLLEILAGVHQAGLVHRDLKPANVRLTVDGQPMLLDFGLAQPPEPGTTDRSGTPGYIAPEVLFGRAGADARSDLYALGVMIFEALRGDKPGYYGWDDAGMPEEAVDMLAMLLAENPDHRAPSAMAVLAEFDDIATIPQLPAEPATEEALQGAFAGPEPFVHFCSRGAALLWARTGGRDLARELTSWHRAGLAEWSEAGIEVTTRGLDRIEDGMRLGTRDVDAEAALSPHARHLLHWIRLAWPTTGAPVRAACGLDDVQFTAAATELRAAELAWPLAGGLGARPVVDGTPDWERTEQTQARLVLARHIDVQDPQRLLNLAAGGGAPAQILDAAKGQIERELSRGAYAEARRIIELALDVGRGAMEVEHVWLRWTAAWAFYMHTRQGYDWALYQLGGPGKRTQVIEQLEFLMRAARAGHAGEFKRADQLLVNCEPLENEALEIGRQSVALEVAKAKGPGAEGEFLDQLKHWASTSSRAARLASWRGNWLYQQERFLEAARAHLKAAKMRLTRVGRLRALLGAGNAFLDAVQLAQATEIAQRAKAVAVDLRLAPEEVWAVQLERSAAYRANRLSAPRTDLVQAASWVGEQWRGMLGLVEAAMAWRQQLPDCVHLAQASLEAFECVRWPAHTLLAKALCIRILGHRASSQLLSTACQCPLPAVGVQALGLCGAPELAWEFASCRPRSRWGDRLEILSFEEALGQPQA